MIKREMYLSQIRPFIDQTELIKVIVGVRRSGKSIMLELIKDELVSKGISRDNMISVNFEDMTYSSLTNAVGLHTYLKEKIDSVEGRVYIFLDEIQKVERFEKAVDSLYIKEKTDIYITGSNAYMLSGELATLLSGRYVEISMLPLSFSEYCQLKEKNNYDELFAEYMQNGGFPYIAQIDDSKEKADMYLEGIYNTIIIKDIEERQKRRENDPNKRKITDLSLFKSTAKPSFIIEPVSKI